MTRGDKRPTWRDARGGGGGGSAAASHLANDEVGRIQGRGSTQRDGEGSPVGLLPQSLLHRHQLAAVRHQLLLRLSAPLAPLQIIVAAPPESYHAGICSRTRSSSHRWQLLLQTELERFDVVVCSNRSANMTYDTQLHLTVSTHNHTADCVLCA